MLIDGAVGVWQLGGVRDGGSNREIGSTFETETVTGIKCFIKENLKG